MKTSQLIIIALLLAFVTLSCGKKQKLAAEQQAQAFITRYEAEKDSIEKSKLGVRDTVLYYQRGACFGMCPIFNLVVYSDGQAVYEGKNFVDMIGFYQTKWDATVLQKILNQANAIGYFGLADVYDSKYVTDLPTTVTGIVHQGKLKTVHNRYKGPANLKTLYNEIDIAIANQKWQAMSTDINNHK